MEQSGQAIADAARNALESLGIRPTEEAVSSMLGDEILRLRSQLKSLAGITEALTGGRQTVELGDGMVTLSPRAA